MITFSDTIAKTFFQPVVFFLVYVGLGGDWREAMVGVATMQSIRLFQEYAAIAALKNKEQRERDL